MDVCNITYDELVQYLKGINEQSFRADQIFEWIYQKQVQ